MEDIFLFGGDGRLKYSYQKDGSESKIMAQQIWAASLNFLEKINNPHCITSPSGKMMFFFPADDDDLFIYISTIEIQPRAIASILRSQILMSKSFLGTFVRPIHMEGIKICHIFQAPQLYVCKEDATSRQILSGLASKLGVSCLAIYTGLSVAAATDDYWRMPQSDIHAIDLLVRYSDAPISDQIFLPEKSSPQRAITFKLFNDLRLVCVCRSDFNAMSAASEIIPSFLFSYKEYLKRYEENNILAQPEVLAWAIVDEATPRYFGDIPPQYESKFVEMICRTIDIVETNRVRDISERMTDMSFFFMPKVYVEKQKGHPFASKSSSHFWTYYALHSMSKDVKAMRAGTKAFMKQMTTLIKPINPPPVDKKQK